MSWEPLHSGDPFPANRHQVRRYGDKVKETGELIGDQVKLLRRLADGDAWRTDTADAFREKAEELADLIAKTQDRYVDVGNELVSFADKLDDFEADARVLVTQAEVQVEAIADNPEVTPTPADDGTPGELTPADRAQNGRRSAAQQRLGELQSAFDGIVQDARQAASTAAGRIKDHSDDDVKDSWWDRNAGWLGNLRTALGIIAAIAGIVLLTVATGGTIWLVALGVAIVAGAAALVISIGNLLSGNGGWADVAMDAVGLLTLGAGGAAIRMMSRGFPAVRTAMAGFRSSQAFAATMNRFGGIPLRLYTRLSSMRFDLFGARTWGATRLAGLTDDATRAGQAAYQATMNPAVTLAQRFVHGGRETAEMVTQSREFLAELRRVPDVPVELLDDVTRMRNWANTATWSANIGGVNDIVDTVNESFDPAQGIKITKLVLDTISRLG
jgi:hypothetical protein